MRYKTIFSWYKLIFQISKSYLMSPSLFIVEFPVCVCIGKCKMLGNVLLKREIHRTFLFIYVEKILKVSIVTWFSRLCLCVDVNPSYVRWCCYCLRWHVCGYVRYVSSVVLLIRQYFAGLVVVSWESLARFCLRICVWEFYCWMSTSF